jgi:hypothetical protein
MKRNLLLLFILSLATASVYSQTNYWNGKPGSFDAINDVSTASVSSGATTGGVWFGDSTSHTIGWFIKNYYRTTSASGLCTGQVADIRMPKTPTAPGYGVLATPYLAFGVNTVTFSEGRGNRKVSVFYTTSDTTVSTYDGTSIPSNWIFVDSTATSATKCVDKVVTINNAAARRVIFTNLTVGGDEDIDSIRVTSVDPILPVGFTAAKAAYIKEKGVQVDWSVATESNTATYVIERSTTGREFSAVGSVKANGNSTSILNYSLIDANPAMNVNYYRIKAVDNDGSFKYSVVLKVMVGVTKTEISVAPNPVKGGQLNVQLSSLTKGNYGLKLYNNVGQLVYSSQLSTEGGSLSQTYSLPSTVKAGVYNLVVTGGDVKLNKRVVVE